jgi:8-oxo-dGTP pyrophosphatase MutT (NUDIX family)
VKADVVRAAGGVVWRAAPGGELQVLLVHRPRYDDWTFPKGKHEAGEDDPACAVREVEEETGLRCHLGAEVAVTEYVDQHGRPKVARYYAMEVDEERGWEPGDEVDALRWLPADAAGQLLSYDRDREVLEAFGRIRAGS